MRLAAGSGGLLVVSTLAACNGPAPPPAPDIEATLQAAVDATRAAISTRATGKGPASAIQTAGKPASPVAVPAGAVFDASGPLLDLLLTALKEAVQVIPENGPLYPSLLMQAGEERIRRIIVADDAATAIARARAAAAELGSDVSLCVLVYDGFVTRGGQRNDAIFAEGHERGAPHGYLLFQQYRPAAAGQPARAAGEPTYVRQTAPLLPIH